MRLASFDILSPSIPLGDWVSDFIDWLQTAIPLVFDFVQIVLDGAYNGLNFILATPSYIYIIIAFTIIAYFVRGWKFALFTLIGFYLIRSFDVWEHTMNSLALVILAVVIAVIISVPIGIWASKSEAVSNTIKPVLDLMQTLSPLVYLVPVLVIFGVGVTPGAIATIVFALAPGVRFTELGIRQVDPEVVEAGKSFGSTPSGILWKIQIPLAMPTIMAGINQVIMLSLSMVVIAGMAGAPGLGADVTNGLQTLNVPLGVNAGLAVVIIAIFLDRLSAAFSARSKVAKAKKVKA
ncbi:ABC transporter permease [Spelaeicoccus albus]|uniref:Glycine betaine/proline transport system permease protein n=1 Tax=Spelaeicoccus albus TaxID=1280376 RepID=A0A7Z0A9G9_9MICO|nr:ABC transporter permease subunit [Spelaeicoccus albus]NYI66048.1 glycine betaine/proline transport system permease protein [Spelaeicoccus albus]